MKNTESIVLFDGHCNLCHRSVLFIIRRDRKARFSFAPLQSDKARQLLGRHESANGKTDTMLLVEGGVIYNRSAAALRIARSLDGAWPLLYVFIVIPRPIRDGVYRWIARNRIKWFGRKDECMVPTDELKDRFL